MRNTWHTGHMRWGRLASSCAASLAVAGCAVVIVGMSRAASKPTAEDTSPAPTPTRSYRPAVISGTASPAEPVVVPRRTATSSRPLKPHSSVVPRPTTSARPPTTPLTTAPTTTHPAPPRSSPHATTHRVAPKPAPTHRAAPRPAPRPAPRGSALPLGFTTGSATRVITVVGYSHSSTTARLQAWTKAPGGGWFRHGSAVTAHVGSDGLSTAASEYRSATPIGSFSLTQAFGAYSDPGTALPYTHTNSHHWWISDVHSSLYNTLQYCHPGCSFAHSPNEHLYYETPYYNYAVAINYNTYPKPVPGRGSAIFLHVTDGHATAGCVAISQSKLVSLMRWLTPSAHPRMLIGVS
jgi:L,D-peptidoglycan transpeptidase YkuD (ErfK/YbiS/YcfS/YnhG family)